MMINDKKCVIVAGILSLGVMGVLANSTTVKAADIGANYQSNGAVRFIPNTDPISPVDPTDPTDPIEPIDPTDPEGPNPGTSGPLSIDFASSFDFGVNQISSVDVRYYANPQRYAEAGKETPNYVQISDNRGLSTGWNLQVKQETQFKNDDAKYSELKGAVITIKDTEAVSNATEVDAPTVSENITLQPGEAVMVMAAAKGAGDGTWISRFGKLEQVAEKQADGSMKEVTKNTSVQLDVPGSTPKSAVDYRSRLTWVLAEVNSND